MLVVSRMVQQYSWAIESAGGCAVQVSKGQWFANLLFWVIVLGAKGAFDYFAIIKPLKLPMRALWNRGFLRSGGWHDAGGVLVSRTEHLHVCSA